MLKKLFERLSGGSSVDYMNIGVEDLLEIFPKSKTHQILDVRTPTELAQDKITDNQIEIDLFDDDFTEKLSGLDKDLTYFVYCRSGNRSKTACKALVDFGFEKVYNVSGGIVGWRSVNGKRQLS